MMHEEFKQLISEYFDGQISSEEKTKLESHLKECADCQAYYIELHRLSAALKKWGNDSLSPDLESKIVKSLPAGKSGKDNNMNTTFRINKFTGGAVLTLATILILTTVNIQTHRSLQGRLKAATDNIGDQYYPQKVLSTHVRDAEKFAAKNQPASTLQYEPYFLSSNYAVNRDENETAVLQKADASKSGLVGGAQRGFQPSAYALQSISVAGGYADIKDKKSYLREAKEIDQMAFQPSGAMISSAPQANVFGSVREGVVERRYDDRDSFNRRQYSPQANTEEYKQIYENPFLAAQQNPLSTFSIDVDNASYSNIRRYLASNQLPPADAVRVEEMINYFNYDYPDPTWNDRFSITMKSSYCPWNPSHQLVQIGIQGKKLDPKKVPPSNLVFLVDVSGSMNTPEKLPLLKEGLKMMVNQISDNERVALVVYAGAAGLVLESTPGSQKGKILSAIDSLQAGGSTAGGAGIQLAYNIAKENFIQNGNNRVILATDGDFNVGISSEHDLGTMIEQKRQDGIFLTVLGFGTGNIKDNRMETLADKGNGNYYYIDNETEARKVLVHELGSTLFTIAKDVKIQVEFNSAQVAAYKLIGYENRLLAKQDFNDDTKDAGELGAGHTVTALYEIVPTSQAMPAIQEKGVDPLVYQKEPTKAWFGNNDVMTVKLRFKELQGNTSRLVKRTLKGSEFVANPDADFRFASAVAEFGLLLRQSPYSANANYDHVLEVAGQSLGKDSFGYRQEFLGLVARAKQLDYRPQQPYYPYSSPVLEEDQSTPSQINFK
jgi:secreted protein with Ig-like and vWFA domain